MVLERYFGDGFLGLGHFGDEFAVVEADGADADPPAAGPDVAGLDVALADPGGPGDPMLSLTVCWEGSSVNKVAVIAPWIALFAVISGASLPLVLRRRGVQS